VEGVLRARDGDHHQGEGEGEEEAGLVLLPELDAAWKAECAALVRRLDDWRRKLRELGDVPVTASADGEVAEASALGRILGGCRALVHGMLEELEVMEQIEREAAAAEMRWVREMNRKGREEDGPRAGAIWRAF